MKRIIDALKATFAPEVISNQRNVSSTLSQLQNDRHGYERELDKKKRESERIVQELDTYSKSKNELENQATKLLQNGDQSAAQVLVAKIVAIEKDIEENLSELSEIELECSTLSGYLAQFDQRIKQLTKLLNREGDVEVGRELAIVEPPDSLEAQFRELEMADAAAKKARELQRKARFASFGKSSQTERMTHSRESRPVAVSEKAEPSKPSVPGSSSSLDALRIKAKQPKPEAGTIDRTTPKGGTVDSAKPVLVATENEVESDSLMQLRQAVLQRSDEGGAKPKSLLELMKEKARDKRGGGSESKGTEGNESRRASNAEGSNLRDKIRENLLDRLH